MSLLDDIKDRVAKLLAKAEIGSSDAEIGVASMIALDKARFGHASRLERQRYYEFGIAAIKQHIKMLQEKIENEKA